MKITFIASVLGKSKYQKNYKHIVDVLEKTGNKVVADHVMAYDQGDFDKWDSEKNVKFHKKIILAPLPIASGRCSFGPFFSVVDAIMACTKTPLPGRLG